MDEQKPDEWLFEVEAAFDLKSLGLIIVLDSEPSGAILRVGDALRFLCADGSEIDARIKQFPMISYSMNRPKRVSIEVPKTPETLRISAGDQAFRRASTS